MPFPLFESLVRQVDGPRRFLLNYSGESTVYPELIPAIRLARSTGAAVELVSVLASAPDALLEPLASSGLTRLTVSIHAADSASFDGIYRYSSFETLRARLVRFVELCRTVPRPPVVDIAFVAMQRNLGALTDVAELAGGLGLRAVSVFPVIRRDEIPVVFPEELTPLGAHRDPFRERVARGVEEAGRRFPEIAFTICNPLFTSSGAPLGEVPAPCPGDLPAGAQIHSCEQNPWETAHVLSNGDVVACEVHDKTPLGSLARQSLAEIWHGDAYRRFRAGYPRGESEECRTCPWKTAYLPRRLHSEILGSRGPSAQLWHGWHQPSGERHLWASPQAAAVLEPRPGSRALHVSGTLPPGPEGQVNELSVVCNHVPLGRIANSSAGMLPFGTDFAVPASAGLPWHVEFRTAHVFTPASRGTGPDQRDLGFALALLSSQLVLDPRALAAAAGCRHPLVFSIASQIVLRDPTKFRDETNWTTLFLENGLATTHDLIPESAGTVEHFYAGGGASLFQRKLLGRVLDGKAYHPFYWEDVEWGWRARKLGFRSLFCAASVAHHTKSATISRLYAPSEIEGIVRRNQLLFHLRNFTAVGRLDDVASAIAQAEHVVAEYFLDPRALLPIARGRLWNHRAPVPDEELLRPA